MAKTKIYKNMNTLFERVKTGKVLTSNYVPTKTFSNISYFKKNEIIKPYLHIIDQSSLDKSVDAYILGNGIDNKLLDKTLSKVNTLRNNKGEKPLEKKQMIEEIQKVYKNFPKEIARDLFNQYYSDIKKLKFEDRVDSNKQRYRMIDKANDPVTKVITKDSHIKSMIFSRNMVQYYLSMLSIIKTEDPQGYEKLMNDLKRKNSEENGNNNSSKQNQSSNNSDSDSDSSNDSSSDKSDNSSNGKQSSKGNSSEKNSSAKSALEKIMQKFLEKPDVSSQNMYDQAMQQAKETSQKLESTMSEEELKEIWNNLSYGSSSSLEKIDDKYLTDLEKKLTDIDMNGDKLKPYLKKILDRSFSYFNGKEKHIYDEFLNSPDISEIIEFEMLHPKLRKFALEDIQVKTTKKIGKINVYIDVSGSMGSSASIPGVSMCRLTFAKAVLLRLKKMDVIDEIYTFNTNVKKKKTEIMDILTIDGNGGTSLNTVIKHIQSNDKNAIIITDADDGVHYYSDKAFFIGVAGANFRQIASTVREDYVNNKQLIQFNGDDVYSIGYDGLPIR